MAPINVLEVFGRRDGDLNLVSRSHDLVFGDWNTFCTRRASSVAGMYLYMGFSLDFGLVVGASFLSYLLRLEVLKDGCSLTKTQDKARHKLMRSE
ncbi:hypothetical protein NC652_030328 [Populus alba x Populus x berolinensis]|nr:hypothetical protein NC652_030328 [Populus alba x Populus x berolinensis]